MDLKGRRFLDLLNVGGDDGADDGQALEQLGFGEDERRSQPDDVAVRRFGQEAGVAQTQADLPSVEF